MEKSQFYHFDQPYQDMNSNKKIFDQFLTVYQQKANKEIQDRICYDYISPVNAYAFTVIDGHGSKQCANFVHQFLHSKIQQNLKRNQNFKSTQNKYVEKSLNSAFSQVQKEWFQIYKNNQHRFEFLRSGACYLTALIFYNYIHIANAGDSEGVILGKNKPFKVSTRFNANQNFQQQRLKRQFPYDHDIIVEKKGSKNNACYVKGELQPTRAIGDFQLKDKNEFWGQKQEFNGPYIEYKPSFSHFRIKSDYEYLILATDGLWDEISIDKIDEVYKASKKKLGKRIYGQWMKKIETRNNMSRSEIKKSSMRRALHDDISMMIVDLKRLKEKLDEA